MVGWLCYMHAKKGVLKKVTQRTPHSPPLERNEEVYDIRKGQGSKDGLGVA